MYTYLFRALCNHRMAKIGGVLLSATVVAPAIAATPEAKFPLKISANRRYLVDARNRPFFYQADTPWMIFKLHPEEADIYLADRKARGFTALQIMMTMFMDMRNCDGQAPFNSEYDLSKPNEAYFAHADTIIRKATEKGFLLALAPLWSGCNGEGWTGPFNGKWKPLNTNGLEKARAYGEWLGARYAKYKNIMWIMGGDHDPDQSIELISAIAAGIHEKAPQQFMTVHNAAEHSSAVFYDGKPWLTINAAYSYRELQLSVFQEWNTEKNVRPVFVIESGYEHEANDGRPGTTFRIRRQAYSAVLNGALVGTAYGHRDIWYFNDKWRVGMADPGATQAGIAQRFFSGRAWWKLEPDQGTELVTDGRGKVDADDYVSAARAADGSLVIAYVPVSHPISVNMARLSGPAKASWFDPTDGSSEAISPTPLQNRGVHQFEPPAKNAEGGGDWVLVLVTAKR